MRPATIFREYIWLVSTIRQAGKITFSALNNKWVAIKVLSPEWLAQAVRQGHLDAARLYE